MTRLQEISLRSIVLPLLVGIVAPIILYLLVVPREFQWLRFYDPILFGLLTFGFAKTKGKAIHLYISCVFYINLLVYRYGGHFGINIHSYRSFSTDYHERLGAYDNMLVIELLYFIMVAAPVIMALWISRADLASKANLSEAAKITGGHYVAFLGVGILAPTTILHFLDLDKAIVWQNFEYTLLKDPSAAGISNVVLETYHRGIKYMPVLALGLALNSRSRWVAIPLLLVFFYGTFYNFISNSRSAALSLGLFAVALFVQNGWKYKVYGLAASLMAYLALVVSIVGRSSSLQGVLGVWTAIKTLDLQTLKLLSTHLIATTFNGGVVVGSSIAQPITDHSLAFKVLSFSPLPSAIDNFSARCSNEIEKLTPNNPYPAMGEVFGLGSIWVALFYGLFFTSLYLQVIMHRRFSILVTLIAGLPLLYITISMQIYPMRTVAKFLAISVLVPLVALNYNRFSSKRSARAT